MLLKDIKKILDCKNHTSEKFLGKNIEYCYSTDMMSDVLRACKIGSLLITGLVNQQVIQIAEIMDLEGIIFVSGKEPAIEIIEKANEKQLPLLTTSKQMFETCGILYSLGLRGKDIYEKVENGTGNSL